jgi:hypothetical protein
MDTVETQCPYCGEPVEVTVEPTGASNEHYVEDCPVCCRPWEVYVTREDGELQAVLQRGDE